MNVFAPSAAPAKPLALRWLLFSGVFSSVYYAAVNVVVPITDPHYRAAHQAVSELSAIGAPTRPLWLALMPAYALATILFAVGVILSAGSSRRIRTAGWLLLANEAIGAFWPPMHQRGEPTDLSDTLHIVFTAAWGLLMLATMILGGSALGRRFALATGAAIALMLFFGVLTSLHAGNIPKGLPTPWIGVWERLNIGIVMAWIAAFAFTLGRRDSAPPIQFIRPS